MATALAALLGPLSAWFWSTTSTVTQPYLDEFFHVRQAQHYCAGSFDVWDPKITTPPGLYVISYLLRPLLGCEITALRSVGALCIVLVLLTVVATYSIRKSDMPRSPGLVSHCAFNIATFPPLFFFSALYYTDVPSTLSVLVFYWAFLRMDKYNTPIWRKSPLLVVLGLISLSFRQTNIFWVAIFPAGLVLIKELDRGHHAIKHSAERKVGGFGDTFLSVARTSYKLQTIYDPPVRNAWFEDYIKTLISIAGSLTKTLTQPARLVNLSLHLSPYLTILSSFALFVACNGSVVLGDKTNHVATLHLAQMLYLWPYIAFFSWPVLFPYLLSFLPLDNLRLPRWSLLILATVLAAGIAHFNTLVHPFTLADNRHYTFYVFRLLTRRKWVKYAVAPVYVVSGWAGVQALGAGGAGEAAAGEGRAGGKAKTSSARISFVLLWLAASGLQLVTAPLVEPRYFILPWVFWRMHLPLPLPSQGQQQQTRWLLWLESAWHLFVQGATGYVFLKWGFAWPQEAGAVQRFMW